MLANAKFKFGTGTLGPFVVTDRLEASSYQSKFRSGVHGTDEAETRGTGYRTTTHRAKQRVYRVHDRVQPTGTRVIEEIIATEW